MEAPDPNPDNMVMCFDGVRRPRPRIDSSVSPNSRNESVVHPVVCDHCSDRAVVRLSNGKEWPCPKCLGGTWNE